MTVGELYLKYSVGIGLSNDALNFNDVILGQD